MYAEGNQTNEFILRDYEKFYIVAMFTTYFTRRLIFKSPFQ